MDRTAAKKQKFELPTVFVIFGITGDLARKKIIKAFYTLHLKNLLPKKFQVYGFSRRDFNDEQLRSYLKDIMIEGKFSNPSEYDSFLSCFFYMKGDFDEKQAYDNLAKALGKIDGYWKICSNKLFYLAVPPKYYRTMLENLHSSGLTIPCSPEEGWTRVILEKPFGSDLQTAKELDALLGNLFKEEQIYRVDHFLAKETVRNILTFRFSNSLLTPAWNNKDIESIRIKLYEKDGVGSRGEFYDKVGALRDVGQNHLLQLLALFTMDNPGSFTPENIRRKRAEALASLQIGNNASFRSVRGQYKGYRQEKGVDSESETETYFKIKALINKSDFQGVPIYIESGKCMSTSQTEVQVVFKHHTPCLCPNNKHYQNVLHYVISPNEKIQMSFLVKKPGYQYVVGVQNFEFDYKKVYEETEFIEDYEQLILDIIHGDQTLFVTTDEIFSQWKFVEPILEDWQKDTPPLMEYDKGEKLQTQVKEDQQNPLRKQIGVIGLGKMGAGVALNLIDKGWEVHGYNRSREKTDSYVANGLKPAYSMKELVDQLEAPRILWIMLPAGPVLDEILFGKEGLIHYLEKGDIVIDAGNTLYKDDIERQKKLAKDGIEFVDVGVSGGPSGARSGACLMVGGSQRLYEYLHPLYLDLAIAHGVAHFEGIGAGHFVKMVHNGIEYGMMQAIGEGFDVLKASKYKLNLKKVTEIYNHGSVIESHLIDWLDQAYEVYGTELKDISPIVAHTGEGAWTVNAAKELGIQTKVIEDSLQFRIDSGKKPTYTGKVVSALRNMFGGHNVKESK